MSCLSLPRPTRRKTGKMANIEEIKLPVLTPDEKWLDRIDADFDLSKEIKSLFYLPHIAYKTAVYAHEKEFTHYEKDRLLLLFRDEAEKIFNVVHNQALLIAGNAPADRIEYLTNFESWKEQLVTLLEKSIECITKEQWIEEFKNSIPSKEQLAVEGKLTDKGKLTVEGKEQFEEILQRHCKRLEESVFDERIYFNKFSKFIIEAFNLLRRFSVMQSITMERTEWIIKGLENIGKLPEKVKNALKKINLPARGNNLQAQIEKIVSERLGNPYTISAKNININIIKNFQGIMGDVQQPENLQVGDNARIYKHEKPEDKKKSIIRKLLEWLIGIIVAAVATDILGEFGWLQSIKAFIYSILWPK